MNTIFHLYNDHGLLVNLLVIILMLVCGITYLKLASSHIRIAWMLRSVWLLFGVAIILLMTLNPTQSGVTGVFASLRLSEALSEIAQPQNGTLRLPDWHDPAANILMTIPLATGLAIAGRARRTILTIALGMCCIETVQHFFIQGRTAQFSDVVLNTMGGMLGVGLAKISHKIVELGYRSSLFRK